MLKSQIAASLMCADMTNIKNELEIMNRAGVELMHIDIMDGVFVPNITLSDAVVRQFRKHTKAPFDYHLMIVEPEKKLDWFEFRPGDMVSVHYEATPHISRAVQAVKARGLKAGAAINPGTPIECLEFVLPDIDFVMLMTVNPGFAGQKLVSSALDKIAKTRRFLDERGYAHVMLEVDGNVSFENAVKMRAAGADIFVAGSSSMFSAGLPLAEGIEKLRAAVGER